MTSHPRQLKGTVVSHRMQKTAVIEVSFWKKHPLYHTYMKRSRRLKAHDERGEYKEGDHVVIEETRPYSKEKRWKIVEKLAASPRMETNESETK